MNGMIYDSQGTKKQSLLSFLSFPSPIATLPPPYNRFSHRFQVMSLALHLVNEGKQVIVFIPTKAGCSLLVKEMMEFWRKMREMMQNNNNNNNDNNDGDDGDGGKKRRENKMELLKGWNHYLMREDPRQMKEREKLINVGID